MDLMDHNGPTFKQFMLYLVNNVKGESDIGNDLSRGLCSLISGNYKSPECVRYDDGRIFSRHMKGQEFHTPDFEAFYEMMNYHKNIIRNSDDPQQKAISILMLKTHMPYPRENQ